MTAPPPPPPPDPNEPTLVQPAARRVVTEEALPPPPAIRPYPWWLWIVAAIFLAAAIVFLVLWLMQRQTAGDVPLLVGLHQSEAQDRATGRGFTLKVVQRPAPGPQGVVVDQAPQAGASLENGAQLMAVVSSGRRQLTVPSLVGLSYERAQQLLTTLGLQPRKATVVSKKPKGTVVSQDPKEGEKRPKGSTIGVAVSTGTGLVTVPSVEGSSQADAVKAVVDAGLVPVVTKVPAPEPEGTVTAQDPAPNEQVRRGSKVRINVSGGSPTTSTQTQTVTTTQTTTTTVTTTTTTP